MRWWLACILVVLGLVVVSQGIVLYRQASWVAKDEVEQMIYDILAEKQDRDADVMWAQVQWNSRLIVRYHPRVRRYLDPYQRYWHDRGMKLYEKWEAECSP